MNYLRLIALAFLSVATASCHWAAESDPLDNVSLVAAADRPALQACLAASDPPGNHWPARAGKARCWLSLPQSPSLDEISTLLEEPHGAVKLERRYTEILAAHYADPAHRDALFRAYMDFQTERGQQLADLWLRKSPGSAFAKLAKGDAELGAAWAARGGEYAAKTTDAQFAAMRERLKVAVAFLREAWETEPKLSPACVDLSEIGNMSSDASLRDSAEQECMKLDPLSWHVNDMWLTELDPRWGGSFDELDRAVDEIRSHVAESPMLASLLSKGIGRRAYMQLDDYSTLLPIKSELESAASTAPDVFYLDKAGVAAIQAGDYVRGEHYLSQAIRFAPDDVDVLIDHAEWNMRTGNRGQALSEIHRAQAQPDDCGCNDHAGIASVLLKLGQVKDGRLELQKAALKPDQRLWAMTSLCQTYFMGGFEREGALSCTSQFVADFPDDAEALYLRALALYIVHDPAAKEFDSRFRLRADGSDPGRQKELQQLDQFAQPAARGING